MSPELKGYKILIKISRRYINFHFNQKGKNAGKAAILLAEKSKITAIAPIC